nr:CotH kinase family protein [Clostridiales bacterium]
PYTSECKPVELYLNHQYNGAYILQEKVEIGENRIDIRDLEKATQALNKKELGEYPAAGSKKSVKGKYKYIEIPENPQDISGGYLLEYECSAERYNSGPSVYTTDRGKLIVVQEPENASKAQMEYISGFMQGFENAIFSDDGIDPKSGKRYDEFIDFESLVLKYMLEEISKNLDGNKSSQFFYKPDDTVSVTAFAGPAWDYDSTFGDYGRAKDSKGLVVPTGFYHNTIDRLGYWWPHLYAKPEYYDAVRRMWQERYAPALRVVLGMEKDKTSRLQSIEEYAAAIEKSAAMNFILWPMRQSSENIARCGKTFKANIEYLTDFISKRYDFLNGEWGSK